MVFRALLLFLLACIASAWTSGAQADVRRCVTPGGQTVFTDRQCTEINAVERVPRDTGSDGARLQRAARCARTVDDLVFELTSAIDGRDANRLAGVYHWPGTSSDEGFRIWTRLDAIASRPLVDIVPVLSGPPASGNPSVPGASLAPPADADLYPQTTARGKPIALRLEQTLGNSATPSRTLFGLTHYFGCWWVRF